MGNRAGEKGRKLAELKHKHRQTEVRAKRNCLRFYGHDDEEISCRSATAPLSVVLGILPGLGMKCQSKKHGLEF